MVDSSPDLLRTWSFGNTTWRTGDWPRIMAIVNVTPDSFSDGGHWSETAAAVDHALELVAAGADILDIGGESTRPGATPVSNAEELDRVVPVIERLHARTEVPISIDTMKAEVARAALSAGASIVNDVSACAMDPELLRVVQESNCGYILMHMQGTPQTMQNAPTYDHVVAEICSFLRAKLEMLTESGIDPTRVMVDPGIGFGKTASHNLEILQNIQALRDLGRPVLIGHSRKRFLGKVLGKKVEERLAGTIGISVALAQQHVDLLRVHDVAAVRDALMAWRAITQTGLTSDA